MERSSGNISASPHFFQWHIEWYQLQQVERKAGFMGGAGVGAGTRASPWPWPHCTVWSPFPKCPGHMPISNGDSKVGTQSTRRKAGRSDPLEKNWPVGGQWARERGHRQEWPPEEGKPRRWTASPRAVNVFTTQGVSVPSIGEVNSFPRSLTV